MEKRRLRVFLVFLLVLCAAFHAPLADLVRHCLKYDLYSHILLIPFVSLYLVYLRGRSLPRVSKPSVCSGLLLFVIAAVAVVMQRLAAARGVTPGEDDYLCLAMFSFVTFLLGAVFLTLGGTWFRAAAFPVLFLYFMMPMSVPIRDGFDFVLQRASAFTLSGLYGLTGTPYFRDGMTFCLPGLTIEVAKECSGIRSSLVLLITALIAGDMFLRSGWRRTLLALSFFPIAALRNAARILAVSLLTIHVDRSIIEGPLHRRGGPPFFVLSLIPLFVILLLLRRSERASKEKPKPVAAGVESGADNIREISS